MFGLFLGFRRLCGRQRYVIQGIRVVTLRHFGQPSLRSDISLFFFFFFFFLRRRLRFLGRISTFPAVIGRLTCRRRRTGKGLRRGCRSAKQVGGIRQDRHTTHVAIRKSNLMRDIYRWSIGGRCSGVVDSAIRGSAIRGRDIGTRHRWRRLGKGFSLRTGKDSRGGFCRGRSSTSCCACGCRCAKRRCHGRRGL